MAYRAPAPSYVQPAAAPAYPATAPPFHSGAAPGFIPVPSAQGFGAGLPATLTKGPGIVLAVVLGLVFAPISGFLYSWVYVAVGTNFTRIPVGLLAILAGGLTGLGIGIPDHRWKSPRSLEQAKSRSRTLGILGIVFGLLAAIIGYIAIGAALEGTSYEFEAVDLLGIALSAYAGFAVARKFGQVIVQVPT